MHKIVYRARLRFLWLLLYLGLPSAIIALSPKPDPHPGEMWLAAGIPLALFLLPIIWAFRAKLELSPEGLTICEGVFTLFGPWKEIRALDLTPGAQGAILNTPLPERRARQVQFWAKTNKISRRGALKDGVQRHRWISEGLFIPLQAFGYRVQSQEFQRELLQRAPHVELLSPAALAAEREESDRTRNIWTFQG